MARIGLLDISDARVLDELVVHLCAADIDTGCADRAALQAAISEAASRGTYVEVAQPGDINFKLIKKAFEFFSASTDEAGGGFDFNRRIGW